MLTFSDRETYKAATNVYTNRPSVYGWLYDTKTPNNINNNNERVQ